MIVKHNSLRASPATSDMFEGKERMAQMFQNIPFSCGRGEFQKGKRLNHFRGKKKKKKKKKKKTLLLQGKLRAQTCEVPSERTPTGNAHRRGEKLKLAGVLMGGTAVFGKMVQGRAENSAV